MATDYPMTQTPNLGPRLRRTISWVAVMLFAGPLMLLPVQALADRWTGSALLPQDFGTRGIGAVLNDPLLLESIRNSVVVAVAATAIGFVLAYPAARSIATNEVRGWVVGALLLPVLLPPLMVGEGLRVWLLRAGLAEGFPGLVLAHLVYVTPYMIIVLIPGFDRPLHTAEQAAETLGSSAIRRLAHISLPMITKPLIAAGAIGFVVSWSQYGSSLGVGAGKPMLPLVLVPFVRSDPQVAAVLDLIFLAPPLLALALAVRRKRPDNSLAPQHLRTLASTPGVSAS